MMEIMMGGQREVRVNEGRGWNVEAWILKGFSEDERLSSQHLVLYLKNAPNDGRCANN
jgi:hypothetical protein